jgi:riboflavin transporter FmnP
MSWNQFNRTKKLRVLVYTGILAALSFVLMRFTEFPIFASFPFLKTDLGDIPILLGAIQLGPLYAVAIVFIKNLLFLASGGSEGGVLGIFVNFIAVSTFGLIVGLITMKRKNLPTILFGLFAGLAAMALVMIPVNLWAAPLFSPNFAKPEMKHELYDYILKVNLPFNIAKGAIDSAIIIPLWLALRKRKVL